MASVALDLTPVVSSLLEHPFDQPTLDRAYSAVSRHPQAYATALRCAAKRSRDMLAAAYWLAEAARVHEALDDLGGAIALLSRALECDRSNPRTRELLAAAMVRLAVRAGLRFTFEAATQTLATEPSPGHGDQRPAPIETGLRPPPPQAHRDTLPELFGTDSGEIYLDPSTPPDPRLSEPPRPEVRSVVTITPTVAVTESFDPPLDEPARMQTMLPPMDLHATAASAARDEALLRAIADAAMPLVRRSAAKQPPGKERDGAVIGRATADEIYADVEAPPTLRPTGDRLVGGVFEALHALHFLESAREGASFVGGILAEKMRPGTILIHLYDINSGHFVVVGAHGSRAAALMDYATPEDDPFIAEVMKDDDATLVREPAQDPRFSRGRWLLAPPTRSVLAAPAISDGRYLGLLEIADPEGGAEFTEDDRHALAYAASAFARFLDRRGIVLSEEPDRSEFEVLPA